MSPSHVPGRTKTYELIRAGEIRVLRVGRATRIPDSEVERFVSERLDAAVTEKADAA